MERARELGVRWGLAAAWLVLPFTLGPALGDALSTRSEMVQRVDSTGLWLLWLAGLIAALVPTTVSLTALRVLAPATLLAAALALATRPADAAIGVAILAVVGALLVMVLALSGPIADRYVNGSSYGDERRFLLRLPAALLIGPVEVAWLLIVVGFVTGPMVLATGNWLAGAVCIAIGWPVGVGLVRSMHGLSRRWLVFVPVGVVIHDYAALIDSVLLPRADIAAIGWSDGTTTGLDLTAGASGRALRIDVRAPVSVLPRPPRRPGSGVVAEARETSALGVAPRRAGAVLAHASDRRLSVRS